MVSAFGVWCNELFKVLSLYPPTGNIGIQLLQQICWKDISFPIELLWHLCKNWTVHICLGLFLDFQFCFINLYVCLYANIMFFFVLKSRSVCPPTLFSKILLIFLGLLHFHISLESVCQFMQKGILIEITLNLYITLERIYIITAFSLANHEYGKYFYLFRVSLISLSSVS